MALTRITSDGITDGTITGSDLATNVDLVDNQKLRLGTGNDLQIYHDGSDSYLINTTGTLMHKANVHHFRSQTNENMAKFAQNGAVELYYDNSKKFETTSYGAKVTGRLAATTSLTGSDNVKLILGDSDDLQIYHDGSHSYLANTTGTLLLQNSGQTTIKGSTVQFENAAGTEVLLKAVQDGAVELYYDNSKKFETASAGVDVSGRIQIDGHCFPYSNNAYDLGLSSNRWRNVYTNDLHLSNEGGANDVDGTWGSYTIQEGAEDLFLINKRNGKKYKFNLTEVS